MSGPGHRRVVVEDRPSRWTPYRVGWVALLVLTVVARLWTLRSWSWLQDDLLLTSDVPGKGLLEYVVQDVAGHVFPGEMLIAWVMTTVSPLNYAWAVGSIVVFAGLIVVGWSLALKEIFGERLHLLVVPLILALSPGATMVGHWWISAINVLPMQASMGFSLWFLARYLRRGHARADLVGLTVSYALGLFMWEKSLLITIPLLFLCLLLGPDKPREAITLAVRALWPAALTTVAYLAFYVWAIHGTDPGNPPTDYARSAGNAATMVGRGLVDLVVPSLAGGPFTTVDSSLDPFPSFTLALGVPLALVGLVLLGVGVVVRRRGPLALAMVLVYALVSWSLVFFSDRFPAYGPGILQIPRYSADLLPVLLLAFMFLSTRTLDEVETEGPVRRPVSAELRTQVRRALVAYAVVVAVVALVSSTRVWNQIQPASTKPWVDNLVGDARDIGKADLYDSTVPAQYVNPILLEPASSVSAILGPLDLPLTYDEPTERYVVLAPDGHLRMATVSGGVTNAGAGPDGACSYKVEPGRTTDIPLTGQLFEFAWGVELTYFTGDEAEVRLTTDTDEVELDFPVNAAGSVGHRQLVVHGAVTSLSLEGLSGSESLCITEVRIGAFEATDEVPPGLQEK